MTSGSRASLTAPQLGIISRIFSIPPNRRDFFGRMLQSAINEAWRGHGKNAGLPRSGEIVRILESVRSATTQEIEQILEERNPSADAAKTYLWAATLAEDIYQWFGEASLEQVGRAIDHTQRLAKEHFMARGRPRGTPSPAFDLFVQELYFYIRAAGGNPGRASKKGAHPVTGPMFGPRQALYKLNAFRLLPRGFIPDTENSKLKMFRKAETEFSNTDFSKF